MAQPTDYFVVKHPSFQPVSRAASPELIVQAKPNDVEAVVESGIEERGARSCCWGGARSDGASGESCDSYRLSAKVDELIFDLRAPMLVEQPFEPASGGPAGPHTG